MVQRLPRNDLTAMHLEILTEDSSTARLMEHLLPKLIGPYSEPHTWQIHSYAGIGHIPRDLGKVAAPRTRMLLNELPRLLRGYVKTPGIDAVVVVMDADRRECQALLSDLRSLAASCNADHLVMFRLAIEETEAWFFGDQSALVSAYPNAKLPTLASYVQDSVCGTWELLADAIHPGGVKSAKKAGWPIIGQIKHEWANRIGPFMDPESNQSPSFAKLRDGLRRLAPPPATAGLA